VTGTITGNLPAPCIHAFHRPTDTPSSAANLAGFASWRHGTGTTPVSRVLFGFSRHLPAERQAKICLALISARREQRS
jgi:hypothetical protein